MKKIQAKNFAELFGKRLPIAKIKDADVRREMLLLATSLLKPAKDIEEEVEAIREKLVEGHEEEVQKWAKLVNDAQAEKDDEKRTVLQKEADSLTEAVRINKEYVEAVTSLYNEEAENVHVRKVSLDTLVTALSDAGFLGEEASVDAVLNEFEDIIKL